MHESDARYLDEIAADLAALLGPKVTIEALEPFEPDTGGSGLRLRYRLAGRSAVSEGTGPTLTAAHADLRGAVSSGWLAILTAVPRPPRRSIVVFAGPLVSFVALGLVVLGPAIVALVKRLAVG